MPYRPTGRTEARRVATRERVVAAARELIARGGYREAQVAAVAARAGVATGTVYRHFPSKADLFAEVFRQVSQREVDATRAAADAVGPAPATARLRPPGGGAAPPAAGAGGGGRPAPPPPRGRPRDPPPPPRRAPPPRGGGPPPGPGRPGGGAGAPRVPRAPRGALRGDPPGRAR